MKAEALRREQARKDSAEKAEEDFKDYMDGKAPKRDEEPSLQDMFKSYYNKAKEVNTEAKNSAMNSLNGFSQKLEQRRQAAREAREKAEQDDGAKKPDENVDKASGAAEPEEAK